MNNKQDGVCKYKREMFQVIKFKYQDYEGSEIRFKIRNLNISISLLKIYMKNVYLYFNEKYHRGI